MFLAATAAGLSASVWGPAVVALITGAFGLAVALVSRRSTKRSKSDVDDAIYTVLIETIQRQEVQLAECEREKALLEKRIARLQR